MCFEGDTDPVESGKSSRGLRGRSESRWKGCCR